MIQALPKSAFVSPQATLGTARRMLAPAEQPVLDRLTLSEQQHLVADLQVAQAPTAANAKYYDAEADAVARTAYYGDLATKAASMKPDELFTTLSTLVSKTHTHQLDYDPSHNLYPEVDVRSDGKNHSIYAHDGVGVTPTQLIVDDYKRHADAAERGTPSSDFHYNCEHVVPQSWFDKKSPMRGDLHHLFACDTSCNSMRGNSLYMDFPEDVPGDCGKTSSDHSRFEPAAGKGAVARATLYFLMRYPGQIGDEKNEYTAADIPMLQKWSREDPPQDYERHRNARTEGKQGNRNPLIDFPELVDKIDFTMGLGALGRAETRASVLHDDYLISCPVRRPFADIT